MLFADVCVNTPLGARVGPSLGADLTQSSSSRVFTYRVPEHLTERLQPGHLVWVPFRGRRMQAIVLALSTVAPEFETHEIEAVVWSQPPLTSTQLAFARWLSVYYLAPLIEALRLMLPAGISQRGRTVLVRSAVPSPRDLDLTLAYILRRIASIEGTWAEVTDGMRGVTQRDHLEPLIKAGLVSREVAFLTPPPHPKYQRQVRLLADPPAIERVLPTVGRSSKQAGVLAWLLNHDDPLPTLDELLAAVGCTEGPVKALAARNWVSIIPRRTSVRRLVADGELQAAGEKQSQVAKQAAALAALPAELVDEAEFRAAYSVDISTLRGLAKKGLIERIEEPAQVTLTLEPEAAREALIALRAAGKHREVLRALQQHEGPAAIGLVYAETGATLDVLRDLENAGLIELAEEMVWRDPLAGHAFAPEQPPALTEDQERVWEMVRKQLSDSTSGAARAPDAGVPPVPGDPPEQNFPGSSWHDPHVPIKSRTMLLYGVTGSGKTEIYLRGIAEVLARGQQAVVLVPEIALTAQTIRRFAARFPGKVTVWHSELGDGERFDVWRRVRTGHPAAQVVVGSRSALFLPYPDLGLIVVDEEHESSYKQERTPRYHARMAAMTLGSLSGAVVLLGSATPSLETYYAARAGSVRLLTLPKRILGYAAPQTGAEAGQSHLSIPVFPSATVLQKTSQQESSPVDQDASLSVAIHQAVGTQADLPQVQVVDMRQELRAGNRSMFSRPLALALRTVLAAGQQAILYLNRRGAATFVMCRDCGHVESCPRCSSPLAYHSTGDQLLCHHCNRRHPVPLMCPECGSGRIRYFGSGTQNVEEAVKQSFPGIRTLRWDRDVTGTKGAHEAILSRFISHEADVLIGTQMIAKGLDLPLVTLVGVVAADIGLFLPDFRAGERTFQLLTQVAGRAGRSALGGQVIVQTYHPDHYSILAASHHDYESFYRQEIAFRREQAYPPLRRLVKLVYYHAQQAQAQAEAERMFAQLKTEITRRGLSELELIGPVPCYFSQHRGAYRWQVIVSGADPTLLLRRLVLPAGWRVDVDPVDLL